MIKKKFLQKASPITALLMALFLALICAGIAHAVRVNNKISGNITGDGKVSYYEISPDGRHTVFLADVLGDGNKMLYRVRTLGGEVLLLSTDLPADCRVDHFLITPDSQSVVYQAVSNTADSCGLYDVSIKGGTPIELTPRTSGVELQNVQITDDSANVLFVRNRLPSYSTLFRVPISGSPRQVIIDELDGIITYKTTSDSQNIIISQYLSTGPRSLIHSDLAGNKSVLVESEDFIPDFVITPNGDYVIFRIDNGSKIELFSIPIIGGTPTRLNGSMEGLRKVSSYEVTPDSAYVVYKADETVRHMDLLYRVPVNGSTDRIPLITDTFADPLKSVYLFEISSDGQWVVFSGDLDMDNRYDLYSVSINGGVKNRLNVGMIDAGDVINFKISPDSLGVVFIASYYNVGVNELFAVNMAGNWGVRLNTDLPPGGNVSNFRISNNSQNVVYRADQEIDSVFNLYVVPSTGGTTYKINPELVPGGSVRLYQITPNDRGVVYLADQDVDNVDELFITYDFQAPTNITLLNNRVHENLPINSVIGEFLTTDPDIGDSFAYSLISGFGDNVSFNIHANQLRASEVFDYASKPVYTIRVKSTDQGGLSIEKNFTIEIVERYSIFLPLVMRSDN